MLKVVATVIVALLVLFGGVYLVFNSINGGSTSGTASTTVDLYGLGTANPSTNSGQATTTNTGPGVTNGSVPTTNTNNQTKIMQATLHTSMGDITLEFYPQQAPNTVANFIKLGSAGFYDGTKFHRVIKGFMDQGGDPLTKDDAMMARWGTGGPGYQFNDEVSATNSNTAGTIAMANSGPNTQGSQFFINAVDNHSLDSGYTVFGKVTAGMDVVTAINNTPTDSSDRPLTPVVLKSVTLK
jgi:cyclophilin family peptidyl-prolyl cis-trans isomerase